jgi:hypothetical protein
MSDMDANAVLKMARTRARDAAEAVRNGMDATEALMDSVTAYQDVDEWVSAGHRAPIPWVSTDSWGGGA